MKVIKPPFGPIQSATSRRGAPTNRLRSTHRASREEQVLAWAMEGPTQQDPDRAARIEDLKRQINAGEYRPNLEIVAERLLGVLHRPR